MYPYLYYLELKKKGFLFYFCTRAHCCDDEIPIVGIVLFQYSCILSTSGFKVILERSLKFFLDINGS